MMGLDETIARPVVPGAPLWIAGARLALIPAARTVLVSDLHLGKSRSFRAQGLAVPEGSDMQTLARLSDDLAQFGATELVILGDLVHNRDSLSDELAALWRAFVSAQRRRDPAFVVQLVPGNHDAGLSQRLVTLLEGLGVSGQFEWTASVADDRLPIRGPSRQRVIGVHEFSDLQPPLADDAWLISGHEHPSVVLRARGQRLRLPCFVIDAQHVTLPAYGGFTGMHTRTRSEGVQLVAVAEGRLFAVP